MQPTNKAARAKAFVNFLIFFAVTIILVLAAGYYSVQVPFKQNEQLRQESENAKNERAFASTFQKKLEEVLSTLEIVNDEKYASEADSYDSQIGEKITDLGAMLSKDSITNKAFYRSVITALTASRIAKKDLREAKSKSAQSADLQQSYQQLNAQYQSVLAELNIYKSAPRN